jgi:hypothetical protein
MPKLNKERSTTSACTFNNTHDGNFLVYVFPGYSQSSWGTIESLDTYKGEMTKMQKS